MLILVNFHALLDPDLYIRNTDPRPGQPNECGSGSATRGKIYGEWWVAGFRACWVRMWTLVQEAGEGDNRADPEGGQAKWALLPGTSKWSQSRIQLIFLHPTELPCEDVPTIIFEMLNKPPGLASRARVFSSFKETW